MQRLLIFIGLLAVAWWLLRSMAPSTRARPQIGRQRARGRFGDRSSGDTPYDDLIACSRCGVHLPRARATMRDGDLYCSADCRDRGADESSVVPESRREQPR